MRRYTAVLVAVLAWTALSGCGSSDPRAGAGTGGATAPGVSGPITVFAAASLTEAFTTLGDQFEKDHPGTDVTFSFASSSALAGQITDGAPADVFASASTTTMDQVVTAGGAEEPVTFAVNTMQIAVPPDNPGQVDSIDDLAQSTVSTALCQPQVPCGATAQKVLDNAGIRVEPVTLEPDVKAVLSKVRLGEVDAGIVYVTDVASASEDVKGVVIPDDVNASTDYPIAILTASTNEPTARAFVDFVLSDEGTSVLDGVGFGHP